MNTKFWGPPGWEFLLTITFNYPEQIDESNPDDVERRKHTSRLFNELQYTLPCKYCRASYKEFLKQSPLEPHLQSRDALTRWFYGIHNMVNEKLRTQEIEAVEKKYNELEAEVTANKLSRREALVALHKFMKITMITDDDPTFEEVSEKFEAQRAGACKKTPDGIASCRVNDAPSGN